MKNIYPILCCVLLVLLGVGIPLAYRQGQRQPSEEYEVLMAFIQAQDDLEVLQALRAGQYDKATKQMQVRVWGMIQPISLYQDLLRDCYWSPEKVEDFLLNASLQFQNHPIILTGVISQEDALRHAAVSSATNEASTPEIAECMLELSRTVAKMNQKRHTETREIVLKHLNEQKKPQQKNGHLPKKARFLQEKDIN
jgi:hypothetical protein